MFGDLRHGDMLLGIAGAHALLVVSNMRRGDGLHDVGLVAPGPRVVISTHGSNTEVDVMVQA